MPIEHRVSEAAANQAMPRHCNVVNSQGKILNRQAAKRLERKVGSMQARRRLRRRETPCAKSAPSECRSQTAETRAAGSNPQSRSLRRPPSRPPRKQPRRASPAESRPADRSPSPESGGRGQLAYDPENQASWRSPPNALRIDLG